MRKPFRVRGSLTLKFTANADIAAEVGKKKKRGQVLVIFAAESQNLLENAQKKLKAKAADLVVANDITLRGSGFDSSKNKVTLIRRAGSSRGQPEFLDLPLIDKHAVAGHIVDQVVELLKAATKRGGCGSWTGRGWASMPPNRT